MNKSMHPSNGKLNSMKIFRIDQKRRFHTVIREKVKQSEKRNLGTRRIDGCLSGLMPSFCGANIPMEVEEQIFALATANSNSSIESSVKVKMQ